MEISSAVSGSSSMGKHWGSAAGRLGWDIAPCAEAIPEADAKLAGLGEPKEDVARVATEIAAGTERGPDHGG
jgi:hypothetical protein